MMKLAPYTLSALLFLETASVQTPYNSEWRSRNWPDKFYASRVLGVGMARMVYFPNGYVSNEEGTGCLNAVAGLRVGTVKLMNR